MAGIASKGWAVSTRAALHGVTLVVTLVCLTIYGNTVVRPPASKLAFVFLVVPLGSLLLIAIVVAIAALISASSRRDAK